MRCASKKAATAPVAHEQKKTNVHAISSLEKDTPISSIEFKNKRKSPSPHIPAAITRPVLTNELRAKIFSQVPSSEHRDLSGRADYQSIEFWISDVAQKLPGNNSAKPAVGTTDILSSLTLAARPSAAAARTSYAKKLKLAREAMTTLFLLANHPRSVLEPYVLFNVLVAMRDTGSNVCGAVERWDYRDDDDHDDEGHGEMGGVEGGEGSGKRAGPAGRIRVVRKKYMNCKCYIDLVERTIVYASDRSTQAYIHYPYILRQLEEGEDQEERIDSLGPHEQVLEDRGVGHFVAVLPPEMEI
ncbi:hypothetical protein AJ80_01334 [Polytolypa hystricis UAMH7299]|uniref:Uncharacterized protein n=1 Tax=Polytolypa hystricis (strain UAMH7299) TaxID=1447883 RepID=A0A2B7Z0K5_POLH7|nr:hypothetical protein AJ80_01334 [Polytolypa hystricis UAMH7299]